MQTNYAELTTELRAFLKELRGGAPNVMKAFSAVAQAALAPNALDTKTKELIGARHLGRDPVRRLHRFSRPGCDRAGRVARGSSGDARDGDLYGSGPVRAS